MFCDKKTKKNKTIMYTPLTPTYTFSVVSIHFDEQTDFYRPITPLSLSVFVKTRYISLTRAF